MYWCTLVWIFACYYMQCITWDACMWCMQCMHACSYGCNVRIHVMHTCVGMYVRVTHVWVYACMYGCIYVGMCWCVYLRVQCAYVCMHAGIHGCDVCMCVCIHVMYACNANMCAVHACMYVWMRKFLSCMYVCYICDETCACMCLNLHLCMYVGMHRCVYVCLHVSMYVCMHVCMYVWMCPMYVCMPFIHVM